MQIRGLERATLFLVHGHRTPKVEETVRKFEIFLMRILAVPKVRRSLTDTELFKLTMEMSALRPVKLELHHTTLNHPIHETAHSCTYMYAHIDHSTSLLHSYPSQARRTLTRKYMVHQSLLNFEQLQHRARYRIRETRGKSVDIHSTLISE